MRAFALCYNPGMSASIAETPTTQATDTAEIEQTRPAAAQEKAESTARRGGLRLAHLWLIVPFSIAWLAQSTGSIEPYDFWWNVKSGEIMMQTGRFLGTDVLVWTPIREPYSNPQWLAQLLFYWLYSASPYLLLTVRVLIVVGALALLMRLCYWKSNSVRTASVVGLVSYFTGWTNYGMRPQLFAFLPFVAFLFLLERKDTHPKWLPLLTPVMLFWVNVHGSFFLGVALLGIYAAGTVLEKLVSPQGRKWLVSRGALWQAICMLAAFLVTLANPYVDFIYRYFFIATNDPIARSLNIEWQAPTIYDGTGILFYSNVLVFLATLYFSKRKLRPTEILLVLAFAYLALTSLRNVIWWGWVTAPIIAANIAAISANRAARNAEKATLAAALGEPASAGEREGSAPRTEVPALNWLIALILVGGAVMFTPLWRPVNPFVQPNQTSALADTTPVKLADFIKQNHPPAPLFNYMEWGGYLEDQLYPSYKLFIDGRFEARTIDTWKDYLSLSRARADWQQTLDRYGIKTMILNKDWHSDLIRFVEASPAWHKIYEDKQGVIFTR